MFVHSTWTGVGSPPRSNLDDQVSDTAAAPLLCVDYIVAVTKPSVMGHDIGSPKTRTFGAGTLSFERTHRPTVARFPID